MNNTFLKNNKVLKSLTDTASACLNMKVSCLNTEAMLKSSISNGLDRLYENVFGEFPFYESFNPGETADILRTYLENKAVILTVTPQEKNASPAALLIFEPLAAKLTSANLLQNDIDVTRTVYLADDAVDKKFRRRGISETLKNIMLQTAFSENCSDVVLRTNERNYAQISAVIKSGGNVIKGREEWVTAPRVGNSVAIDRRIYYRYNLNNMNKEFYTAAATIAGETSISGRDSVYIENSFSDAAKDKTGRFIADNYPGLKSIIFIPYDVVAVQVTDPVQFKGNLPIRGSLCM